MQEKTKDEEKHLDAELHTDLIGEDKRNEIKKAGGILEDIGTALTSTDKTKGDLLERYKQASMMRAIGEQVEKNPEYLSILEKNVIRNGKIDDESQVEQVSVMNKLLNEALRAKGYKGAEIKMVLTDVTDPKGAYYTDTLTNTVVFDRNKLANANRDEILNALGHEFGHYSKADDIDKSQDIANYTGGLLEKRTKNLASKEATEERLEAIRNNKNVITGEEGKKLAESIPEDRREYEIYQMSRPLDYSQEYYDYKDAEALLKGIKGIKYMGKKILGLGTHGYALIIPDDQTKFFDEKGNLKQEYKHYPKPEKYGDKLGWTVGGHNIDKKLEVVFNQEQDKKVSQKKLMEDTSDKLTPLNGHIGAELKSPKYKNDTEFIEAFMEKSISYMNNNKKGISPKYGAFGQGKGKDYIEPRGNIIIINSNEGCYNCNSYMNSLIEKLKIDNFNRDMPGLDPGSNTIIDDKYFKINK